MLLLGNTPAGWRFAPLCFGLQSIVLVFLIARSLFDDRRAGWLAAAVMGAGGVFPSCPRRPPPGMIPARPVLWGLGPAVTAPGWPGRLALPVVLPACFAILILRRAPWYTIASFALVPIVHLAVWQLGLALIGQPYDLRSVWHSILERQRLHLGFPHGTNPAESSWYTWLVLYHPLVIKSAHAGGKVRLASSVGNPALWIPPHLCLRALPLLGGAAALSVRWRARRRPLFCPPPAKSVPNPCRYSCSLFCT